MPRYTKPFLLSSAGSTRATAYTFSNKSVTFDGRTHVVWLDAVSTVRGRTFDHAAGTPLSEVGGEAIIVPVCNKGTVPVSLGISR